MELAEFSVQIIPSSGARFQTVRYLAEFIKHDGERIALTREKQVEAALLQDPYTAAWILSHILQDFMTEVTTV